MCFGFAPFISWGRREGGGWGGVEGRGLLRCSWAAEFQEGTEDVCVCVCALCPELFIAA